MTTHALAIPGKRVAAAATLETGDPRALVAHLVSEHEIDADELRDLRRRVSRRRGRE